jgi:hypothetical protein
MLTEFSNSSSTLYDTGVLAHQGGWDEILLVAGPILLIVLVLWRATRRAEKIAASREAQAASLHETSPTTGD